MKSSANWIGYICLTPNEPDWHKRQQAVLSEENPIDSLVKAGFNFLDDSDLATVSRINDDNCLLH